MEADQIDRLRSLKRSRNNREVGARLGDILLAARQGKNLMPYIIEAVKEYATLGEISDIFREAYGVYTDPGYF